MENTVFSISLHQKNIQFIVYLKKLTRIYNEIHQLIMKYI